MKEKVVIIGGKGTAVVIAEQIYDAQIRFGKEIEVIGFAFDDPAFLGGINGWPVLCGTKAAYEKFKDDADIKFVFAMYRSDLLKERIHTWYLQPIITQYFIDNKSEIWLLFLIAHSKR